MLVKESSSNVERNGSDGKLERERRTGPWKITKVLNADLIIKVVMEGRNTRTRHVSPKGIKPFRARPPICAPRRQVRPIRMFSGLWTNHPIRSS